MPADAAIHDLLRAMPPKGWMIGCGSHRDTLMLLLDRGSSLIEENVMPEDDIELPVWMVRLTPAGLNLRSLLEDWCD
jgi:hypothetical protein